MRRLAVVVVVALAVAGVVVADRTSGDPQAAPEVLARLGPTAPAPDTGASTWYCPAGSASGAGGTAEQTVVLANLAGEDRVATVTAMTSDGQTATEEVGVAASARVNVAVADLVEADWAGVLVEANGGGVAVDHVLGGATGTTAGPCASSASAVWYLPAGSTELGVDNRIAILNPFPDLAVVDIEVATDDGRRVPPELEGLVVDPTSVRVVDLSAVVTVRDQVAATVTSRSGLVVVEGLEVTTSEARRDPALSVTLGAPSAEPAWYFPELVPTGSGVDQAMVVFNPTDVTAEVDLQVLVDDPATNGFVEPFELTVRPFAYQVVALGDDDRVPGGIGLGAYVETRNDVPVVAARVVRATGADTTSPSTDGVSVSLGTPVLAGTWVVPLAADRGASELRLGVANLGVRDAEVTVEALTNGETADVLPDGPVTIPAGQRSSIDVGGLTPPGATAVVVRTSPQVAVERSLGFGNGDGFMLATAIALDGTLERPGVAQPDAPPPEVVLDGVVDEDVLEEILEDDTTTTPAPDGSERPGNGGNGGNEADPGAGTGTGDDGAARISEDGGNDDTTGG